MLQAVWVESFFFYRTLGREAVGSQNCGKITLSVPRHLESSCRSSYWQRNWNGLIEFIPPIILCSHSMNCDEQRKFSCELFKIFLQNLWHIPKTLWNLHLSWDFAVFCIISWVCLIELWSKECSSRSREVRFHPWNMFSSPLNLTNAKKWNEFIGTIASISTYP